MGKRLLAALGVVLCASSVLGYEWLSHNRMTWNGRDIFLGLLQGHRPPYPVDQGLIDFLAKYGESDLDTRAGDRQKDDFTDEDHNEGGLSILVWCVYYERPCSWVGSALGREKEAAACTFNHFYPALFPGYMVAPTQPDAISHAHAYWDLAIKLYKAGACSTNMQETYYRWAAQALGHAIHLVEDMGSPQHVLHQAARHDLCIGGTGMA